MLPVITVEVVEPAAFFDQADASGGVQPGGVTVQPLVFLPLTPLKTALIGFLRPPVIIVVDALSSRHLCLTASWQKTQKRRD